MNLHKIVIKVQINKAGNWQVFWWPNRCTGNYFKNKYWHVNCPRSIKTEFDFKTIPVIKVYWKF